MPRHRSPSLRRRLARRLRSARIRAALAEDDALGAEVVRLIRASLEHRARSAAGPGSEDALEVGAPPAAPAARRGRPAGADTGDAAAGGTGEEVGDAVGSDAVLPPLTLAPNRPAEAAGALRCWRCARRARWHPWADAWVAACAAHAPEDDAT